MAGASIVDAQPAAVGNVYAVVGVIADIKRFSGDPADNKLDGEAPGASITLGASIAERWSVEVDVVAPRSTVALEERSVAFRRSTITLESRTRNRPVSAAAIVHFRAASRGRAELGYLAGLSFVRLRRDFDTLAPADTSPSLLPRPLTLIDYGAATVVGVDARISLFSRLSVVPAIHASVLRVGEVSALLLRPRVGVRWTF
jgi:hypothetical protein